MRRLAWMGSIAVVAASIAAPLAQQPDPPRPAAPQEGPTFRVDARLATIDAVVVDEDGRHVTDLTPADFEVVERGRRQTIRQAVYIRVERGTPAASGTRAAAAPAAESPGAAPAPPRLGTLGNGLTTPERTGRILAIVVDDLGLSVESAVATRQMLLTFVDTQFEPGDLVAIVRTSGGTGALQQFTTDRRLLRAAAERIRWTSQSRNGVGTFEPMLPNPMAERTGPPGSYGTDSADATPYREGSLGESVDDLRRDSLASGSLGALQYVLRGIETLPGRKSVVFVSEGLDLGLTDTSGRDRASRDRRVRTWPAFTRVMDNANRSGVVLYAIDPRGVVGTGFTAQDTLHLPGGLNGAEGATAYTQQLATTTQGRVSFVQNTQASLTYLAEQTGGFAVVSNNRLAQGLAQITEDMRGYYLIGFDTALDLNAPWDPKDVQITVKRKGLRIRSRRGLFGPAVPRPRTAPADSLLAAAMSPFDAGSIDVRLTGLFGYDASTGPYVHTMFFVDPATVTFTDTADGQRQADLSLLLLAIGDDGLPVARIQRRVEVTLTPGNLQTLRRQGLLYTERLPIKTPGGYQVRAAILDERTKTVGTSAQFIQVPRVGKDRVALSGVVMTDVVTAKQAVGLEAVAARSAAAAAPGALAEGALAGPATKIFKPGSEVVYACDIYDGRNRRTEPLTTQTTLLRDGQPIFTGPVARVAGADPAQRPVGKVPVNGSVTLGHDLVPGVYSLQVTVRDGDRPKPAATQWVDFEVR